MDISKFSQTAIFVPPKIAKGAISVTNQECINKQINKYFNMLAGMGIKNIGCIGGLHLDYERYLPEEVMKLFNYTIIYPHILPTDATMELALTYYPDTDEGTLQWEIDTFSDQTSLITAMLQTEFTQEVDMLIKSNFKHPCGLVNKWIPAERFLIVAQPAYTPSMLTSVKRYKTGLKLELTLGDAEWYTYGNKIREELILN